MQVVRQLRAQIASGELAEGERIPSQREMMQIWRISMQTASKVIGALKTEGLAIPSVGRDTIVAPGAAARIAAAAAGPAQAVSAPQSSAALVFQATAAITKVPAEVGKILGVPPGSQLVRRQEIAGDSDNVISVTTTWFPPDITRQAPMLAENQPLPSGILAYIAEATGASATRVHEQTAAVAATAETAATLGVPVGSPVLLTREGHANTAGQLIAHAETAARPDNWRVRTYTILGS